METWRLIVTVVGMILVLLGTVMIFDARIITKKIFSFGDQNGATRWMKIIGVVATVIGAGVIIFI